MVFIFMLIYFSLKMFKLSYIFYEMLRFFRHKTILKTNLLIESKGFKIFTGNYYFNF